MHHTRYLHTQMAGVGLAAPFMSGASALPSCLTSVTPVFWHLTAICSGIGGHSVNLAGLWRAAVSRMPQDSDGRSGTPGTAAARQTLRLREPAAADGFLHRLTHRSGTGQPSGEYRAERCP